LRPGRVAACWRFDFGLILRKAEEWNWEDGAMPGPRKGWTHWHLAADCLLLVATVCLGQSGESRPPASDDVKRLQAGYETERDRLTKSKLAPLFLPEYMERAAAIAQRGEQALASGRMVQAAEAFRQARWQLPYEGAQFPQHVAHVFGNLRLRHGDQISSVAFSPDGTRLATASRDATVKIWDLANGHELAAYRGHQRDVRWVAFGPGAAWVASAGGDPDIHIWVAQTGKPLRLLKSKADYVTTMAVSHDGKFVFAGGSDRILRVYDAETGDVKRSIGDFASLGGIRSLACSPDGTRLAAGADNGQVRLWAYPDIVTQNALEYWQREDHSGSSNFLTFSPDSKLLARCSPDGIKVYDVQKPGGVLVKEPNRIVAPTEDRKKDRVVAYSCAAISKDMKTLFAGSFDGAIRLFDLETGQSSGIYQGHNAEITALTFNRDGTQLASASADSTVRLWDFDVVVHARQMTGHTAPVWAADFCSDGRRIVSAGADRTARVWDFATGTCMQTVGPGTAGLTAARFSPDGKTLLLGGGDKNLRLYDANTGQLLQSFKGHSGAVTAAAFDKTGTKIVSGGADETVIVWSKDTGKVLQMLPVGSLVMAVAFTPDAGQVAVGSVDQYVRLFDAASGKAGGKWLAHRAAVGGLAFDDAGGQMATCGFDGLVRVWRMSGPPTLTASLAGHIGPVSAVAFHPGGSHLVSAGSDRLVKLWKKQDDGFKEAQVFKGHQDWVTALAFSRDGYFVLSAAADKTVRVWEMASRELPLTAEHTGAVNAVAVSPDGKLIASGGTDRTIKIWERGSGKELATLRGHSEAIVALAFAPDGKTLYSSGADRNLRAWDPLAGKAKPDLQYQFQWTGFVEPVPAMAVTADGTHVLAWEPVNERGSSVLVFKTQDGDQISKCIDRDRHVVSAGFSGDGKTVALGSKDGVVRVWKPLENKTKPALEFAALLKTDAVTAIAVDRGGELVVLGCESGKLLVCEAATGKVTAAFAGHGAAVRACALSGDNKKVISASVDGIVKLWDRQTQKELRSWTMPQVAGQRSGFVSQIVFTPDGRFAVTANANSTLYLLETDDP
jgi:WD40 repeat protein